MINYLLLSLCALIMRKFTQMKSPMTVQFVKRVFGQSLICLGMKRFTRRRGHTCVNNVRKKFKVKESLRIHGRIHIGEKPYECHVCQKTFATKNECRLHRHTHKDEKHLYADIATKDLSLTVVVYNMKNFTRVKSLYE